MLESCRAKVGQGCPQRVFHVEQIATIGAIWSIDSSSGCSYLPVKGAAAVEREAVHCNVQTMSEASRFRCERACASDPMAATLRADVFVPVRRKRVVTRQLQTSRRNPTDNCSVEYALPFKAVFHVKHGHSLE
jgi:hypothetical protein